MKRRDEFIDGLARFIGLAVLVLVVVGGLIALVYGVIGELTDEGRHILATALVFAVPGAWLLGWQVARAHRAGIERGIDLKIGAAARPARPTVPSPGARFDDVLPKMGQAVIVTRADDSRSSIDL